MGLGERGKILETGNRIRAEFADGAAIFGDLEKALFWLEKSYEEYHPWTTWIKAAPEFETLNNKPRYQEILRKMNL